MTSPSGISLVGLVDFHLTLAFVAGYDFSLSGIMAHFIDIRIGAGIFFLAFSSSLCDRITLNWIQFASAAGKYLAFPAKERKTSFRAFPFTTTTSSVLHEL